MSYARGTVAALVDAVVPETPDLDEDREPGALAIDLDAQLATAFDELQETGDGLLASLGYETMPYGPVLAVLLDVGALELIVRREREDPLRAPADAYASGPFSRLSPEDRMRALRMLEADGIFPRLDEQYGDSVPVFGVVAYLVQAALFVTYLAAYSDLGDDGDGDALPQGWRQADYPGPAEGYAVGMGYEVDEFEENDYGDGADDGTGDSGEDVATDGGTGAGAADGRTSDEGGADGREGGGEQP